MQQLLRADCVSIDLTTARCRPRDVVKWIGTSCWPYCDDALVLSIRQLSHWVVSTEQGFYSGLRGTFLWVFPKNFDQVYSMQHRNVIKRAAVSQVQRPSMVYYDSP